MRQAAKTFQDLIVWQKAHQFVLNVYKLTGQFPKSEIFGLSSQFRRASVSIAANIAEGFKKKGRAVEEGVRSQNPGVRITFVGDSDPNEKVDTVQTMGF